MATPLTKEGQMDTEAVTLLRQVSNVFIQAAFFPCLEPKTGLC